VLLGQALREYAGAANRSKLLALLMPVQRAAEVCTWLRPMVDSGEIYHPLRWTPQDAATLLASVASLESAGVIVRMGSVIPRAGGRFEGSWVPGVGSAGLQPVGCRDGLRVVSVRGGDGAG
jgi:hypothetical protein